MTGKKKTAMLPKLNKTDQKLLDELKKKRANLVSSVQFRHDTLETQKRINYQNEFDRLQGAQKIEGLKTHTKNRMKDLQDMARKSLNGELNIIYTTKI